MKSLRQQLIVGAALGTVAVLIASGVLLYVLISRTLHAEFDESLATKARSLAAMTEQEGNNLDFEPAEAALPEFEPSEHAEYYQLWLPDGSVFARSPSLLDGNLPRIVSTPDAPSFETVHFPDGRPGRIVGISLVPRQEHTVGGRMAPMIVTLVVGRETLGLHATLARVRGILIGVCILAVGLSAGVLAWVVRRGLAPLERLSRQIAEVGENDLSARVDAPRLPLELSPVVDRLNDLLARLEAAFQRERRFTGDVAHELRTPLAGLRSKLELALSRDRTSASYRDALADCLQINLQMQRMVEVLLHLVRADAGQLEIRGETVDLAQVVRACWAPLANEARARDLRVDWKLGDGITVVCDPENLRLVLKNVLDNAVTYVDDNGCISISTAIDNGVAALDVSNSGSDLPDGEIPRIFDRFWRRDSSYHQPGEIHCGLGLPLCKAILDQLGGSISGASSSAGIFTITIRLPRM